MTLSQEFNSAPTMTFTPEGNKEWRLNGLLHREDGPAVEDTDGDKWWYRDDKLHRDDGPAVEYANGTKEWWVNGIQLEDTEIKTLQDRIQQQKAAELQQKATELRKALTEALTKGFAKDLVAPTTARFKPKVRS